MAREPPLRALPADVGVVAIDDVWASRDACLDALTAEERAVYAALRIDKRRQDWLAGRLAAKRAIQRATGAPFSRITIRASADPATKGRPEPFLDGAPLTLDPTPARLSISHAGGLAAACLSARPIGLDLEEVTARDDSFARTFLDDRERAELAHLHGAARDRALAARWCLKEAIAKWLGLGLVIPFAALSLGEARPDIALEEGRLSFRGRELCWVRVRG